MGQAEEVSHFYNMGWLWFLIFGIYCMPSWPSPLSFLLSESCDFQVTVTNKVSFCQRIPPSDSQPNNWQFLWKCWKYIYICLLCLFKSRSVCKGKKKWKWKVSCSDNLQSARLNPQGTRFCFSQCRFLPPLFTHLETKAIVKTAKGEGRGFFCVCGMRSKFILETAWNRLQKMDRVSSGRKGP